MTPKEVKDAHDEIWASNLSPKNSFKLHYMTLIDSVYLPNLPHGEYALKIAYSSGKRLNRGNTFETTAEVEQFLKEIK